MWWNKKEVKGIPARPKRLDAEMDIEGLDVFSVERLDGKTLVSFFIRKHEGPEIMEWTLDIEPECHEYLIRRYREKLGMADIKRRAEFPYVDSRSPDTSCTAYGNSFK